MKYIELYNDISQNCSEEQIFENLISSLKPSITLWTYFVNWGKVLKNTHAIELYLNQLNYLIGKDNFDDEFKFLLKESPKVIKVLPALAVRDGANTKKFKIIASFENNRLIYEDYDFSKTEVNDEDILKYLEFVTKTGIKDLLVNKRIKNLVDYMIGVEAGLDSNGRKNRSGTSMETIVESFIKDFCTKRNYTYLSQANAKSVRENWNIDIPVDKTSRRYDFVINTGDELLIIETNFYGGGGSKLKATAGEYRKLNADLDKRFKFLWITDGYGWKTTHLPLREAFNELDYIFNLEMLEKGALNNIPLNQS